MRVSRSKRWVRRHQVRFEGIIETRAHAVAQVFACPRTGSPRHLGQCLRCPGFVNARPAPGRDALLVRCLCTDDDPLAVSVESEKAWPCVTPETRVADARALAHASGAPMLLVARGDDLTGVIEAAALERADDGDATVAEHVSEYPWALSARAAVGDAVEALAALRVPALLLISPESRLLGLVSRRQLARIGVPNEHLP